MDEDEDLAALEALEASGPLISPETMTRKQRYRRWWGRGGAAKAEFSKGYVAGTVTGLGLMSSISL